ncbi:hypothetical protein [Brachyspira hampsonii]|uniref:hypothetical protein n=1 Tax=Brachyspira hampsonii TaxID=1287055 RepID=UPI000D378ACC|nr:hypothetical protein [Brachyspira hampsonii]PTY39096.1 hypothetical protein DQ06_00155 [Brachyspira hampsonii bv. II]
MNKKLFSILFTLFLVGVLSVSCSNKDKTGSGESTESGKGFGFDQKYAYTWIAEGFDAESGLNGQQYTINQDGSMTPQGGSIIPASEIIKNSDSSYTIYGKNTDSNTGDIISKTTMNIDFTSDTSAVITIIVENINPSQKYEYKGNLTRQ